MSNNHDVFVRCDLVELTSHELITKGLNVFRSVLSRLFFVFFSPKRSGMSRKPAKVLRHNEIPV
jgi:hypothetical protein